MEGKNAEILLRLLQISRELTSETDTDVLLQRIMDAAIDVLEAERGFLCLRVDDTLQIAVARNLDQEEVRDAQKKLSQSIIQEVMATGEPLVSLDAGEDERLSEARSVHKMKIRSVACIPLKLKASEIASDGQARQKGSTIGCVYLDHRFQTAQFLETDVEMLEIFGAHAAMAVTNARLVAMLRQRNAQLNTQLEDSVHQLLQTRSLLKDALANENERHELPGVVYASRAMHEVLGLVKRVAGQELPILVTGESGTGKELLAKAIHSLSARSDRNFVPVNCGAIPEGLFESELFGHKRGAFTGAERDREGLVETANGGTLFLDEVTELPLQHQVKLLRVLQEGEVRRIGEDHVRRVDFRVLSACNKDLQEEVRQGRFREDLFYRLRVFHVELPPLRKRAEDIPLLVELFVGKYGAAPAEEVVTVDPEVYPILANYTWPGNIRELENEMKRALALCNGPITAEDLSPHIIQSPKRSGVFTAPRVGGRTLEEIMAVVEREVITEALAYYEGNKSRTAQHLGISRNGLAMKMERLGIE